MTPWTVTAVWLQGGFRAEWAEAVIDVLVRDTRADGRTPVRVTWLEFLVRDWLEPEGRGAC